MFGIVAKELIAKFIDTRWVVGNAVSSKQSAVGSRQSQLINVCWLLTAYCLLPTANCRLPTANCLLLPFRKSTLAQTSNDGPSSISTIQNIISLEFFTSLYFQYI
jgi:hypothetical protein